jgi:hypothetical protein
MNCVELQKSLAEDVRTVEQKSHLNTCRACSALAQEMDLIVAAASQLRGAEEPSPRVWNSIEFALRKEGLIRPQPVRQPVLSSFGMRWGMARWVVPVAAMVLLAIGITVRRESAPQIVDQQTSINIPKATVSTLNLAALNDEDLIQEVATNPPAMKTEYEENLRRVNASIREAQSLVDESPNDVEARRSLMDAYQQKSMLFEMAMDSLP